MLVGMSSVVALTQNTEDTEWRFHHWESIALNYEFSKVVSLGSKVETRFETDPSELRKVFIELEPTVKISKWLSAAVGYRYNTDLDNNWNRFYIQAMPAAIINKSWRIDGRLLYTWEKERFITERFFRARIKPRYKMGKSRISISTEAFVDEDFFLEKWRHGLWYQVKIRKNQIIKSRLALDVRGSRRTGIIALGYEFRL
jgi:hypothetical protein